MSPYLIFTLGVITGAVLTLLGMALVSRALMPGGWLDKTFDSKFH